MRTFYDIEQAAPLAEGGLIGAAIGAGIACVVFLVVWFAKRRK